MKSSKEVLEKLHNKLLFLEEYAGDTLMRAEIDDCIRYVGYLEEIINELIGETVDLEKSFVDLWKSYPRE
jgi:hypothetical protein